LIDYHDFKHIIKKGESEKIEFKSSFNHELIETIVAFSNSTGGKIIIGINQKNEFIGVAINDESVQNWVNEIKTKTSPQIGVLKRTGSAKLGFWEIVDF